MRHHHGNDGQYLFDIVVSGFVFFLKLFFQVVIYSPFLIAAYLVAKLILHKNDHALLWLIVIFIFSFALIVIFSYLKRTMTTLRKKRNFCWIPIFIFCAAFSSLLPAWLIYEPVKNVITKLTRLSDTTLIAGIISLAFGYFVYNRHRFFEEEI